jgi:hypothetical protein
MSAQTVSPNLYLHLKEVEDEVAIYVGYTEDFKNRSRTKWRNNKFHDLCDSFELNDDDFDASFGTIISVYEEFVEKSIIRVVAFLKRYGFIKNCELFNIRNTKNSPVPQDFRIARDYLLKMYQSGNRLPNYKKRKAARFFKKLFETVNSACHNKLPNLEIKEDAVLVTITPTSRFW